MASFSLSDTSVSKAIARLSAIREEIAALQAEAGEIEGALEVLRRFGEIEGTTAAPTATPESAQTGTTQEPTHWKQGGIPTMSQAEFEVVVMRLIREAGRPLSRAQVIQKFAEAGTPITGDASKNAGTKLWRARDKIINIRGAGYWLRHIPCPAVGYDLDHIGATGSSIEADEEDHDDAV